MVDPVQVKQAPMTVERSVLLPVDPEEAWLRLLRWEEQPAWMVDAARVDVVGRQREGLGVRLAVRTRVLGLPFLTDRMEIVVWEPPRRMVLAHRGLVRGTGVWELEPAQGGSRFTWTEVLSLRVPLLGELLLQAYRPVMGSMMRRSLAN